MEKHLLVTVSDDFSSSYSIQFVCSFIENKRDVKITLLYIAPRNTGSSSAELEDAWRSPEELSKTKISAKADKALTGGNKILCRNGFSKENIDTKIITRQQTKISDIIREGHSGKYDAVVLGRRGASAFEVLLSESVTDGLLAQNVNFPIWICKELEKEKQNILLCIDGSEAALRMADHVGYILAREPRHQITLFHVDKGQGIDISKAFAEATRRLEDNGIDPKRITTKKIKSLRVASALITEARKNKYAVVAMGLVGRHHSGLKGWLAGTKSVKLVKKLDSAILWVCR